MSSTVHPRGTGGGDGGGEGGGGGGGDAGKSSGMYVNVFVALKYTKISPLSRLGHAQEFVFSHEASALLPSPEFIAFNVARVDSSAIFSSEALSWSVIKASLFEVCTLTVALSNWKASLAYAVNSACSSKLASIDASQAFSLKVR